MKELINDYFNLLKKEMDTALISEDLFVITTPFLDKHNDLIDVYVKLLPDEKVIITDKGETFNNLKQDGIVIGDENFMEKIDFVIYGLSISIDNDELILHANTTNFAQKFHNFIQTIIKIDSLFISSFK